jgi:hypothetical protein
VLKRLSDPRDSAGASLGVRLKDLELALDLARRHRANLELATCAARCSQGSLFRRRYRRALGDPSRAARSSQIEQPSAWAAISAWVARLLPGRGTPRGDLLNQGNRVVGEEGVGAPCELEVVGV